MNSGKYKPFVGGQGQWSTCDQNIQLLSLAFAQFNYGYYLADLLDADLPVLIYTGDQDYFASWNGAQAWAEALEWRYQREFQQERFVEWKTHHNSSHASGEYKQFEQLTLFRVYNASHMVPRDQPEVAHRMIMEFIEGGMLLDKTQQE